MFCNSPLTGSLPLSPRANINLRKIILDAVIRKPYRNETHDSPSAPGLSKGVQQTVETLPGNAVAKAFDTIVHPVFPSQFGLERYPILMFSKGDETGVGCFHGFLMKSMI